jgi:outer membrane protein
MIRINNRKILNHNMKKYFACFCTLGLFLNVWAQEKTTMMTLKQVIETALKNNFDVQRTGLQTESAEINWKQSKFNLLPDLNGSANYYITQGRTIDPSTNLYTNQSRNSSDYGLNSSMLLFQGLSAQNLIKQSHFEYEASKMDWQQSKDNLTINIILNYLRLLGAQDQLTQSQNQAEFSKNQVERLQILDKEGAVAPPDLYNLKAEFAGDQAAILDAENSVVTARINLFQLMNLPYDKNVSFEKMDLGELAEKYELSSEEVYQASLQQFAQVKSVELKKQGADKAVKVAKGRLFPSINLYGQLGTSYTSSNKESNSLISTSEVPSTTDYVLVNNVKSPVIQKQNVYSYQTIPYKTQLDNNRGSGVSIGVNIPIFNRLQQQNRIKLAKIDLKNSELLEKNTKTELQQNIESAYENMTTALGRYKLFIDQVQAFDAAFKAAEVKFNAGLGTSIDYLLAKNSLDRATINLINAKYDYALRRKILDYYQGKQLF